MYDCKFLYGIPRAVNVRILRCQSRYLTMVITVRGETRVPNGKFRLPSIPNVDCAKNSSILNGDIVANVSLLHYIYIYKRIGKYCTLKITVRENENDTLIEVRDTDRNK